MLVNLNKVLKYAEEHNCAIGSFNMPTLENIIAVISAAEEKMFLLLLCMLNAMKNMLLLI